MCICILEVWDYMKLYGNHILEVSWSMRLYENHILVISFHILEVYEHTSSMVHVQQVTSGMMEWGIQGMRAKGRTVAQSASEWEL